MLVCQLNMLLCQINILLLCQLNMLVCQFNMILCQINIISCQINMLACQFNMILCQINIILCQWNCCYANEICYCANWIYISFKQPHVTAMSSNVSLTVHVSALSDVVMDAASAQTVLMKPAVVSLWLSENLIPQVFLNQICKIRINKSWIISIDCWNYRLSLGKTFDE